MWTTKNRKRYDRSHLRYPSDLSDEEWQHIAPLIHPAKQGGRKRTADVREVVNGIMYVLSTGCQWRYLPKDLPPKSTVYRYFDLWNYDGTLEAIHYTLYVKCREAEERDLHSAGLAHNLERIFYAILRLKTGRFEIVATTSVEDAVRASNSRGQSDVRADRRLYAPFNGRAANSLAEGAQRDSTPRTWRLERFPVHALLVDREGPRQLALQRATVLASSERISHYE